MADLLRGHPMYYDGDRWRYVDNDEPTAETWQTRDCGHCNLPNRADEHDACLGELAGVCNACCGHGLVPDAYVEFDDGVILRGMDATVYFAKERR